MRHKIKTDEKQFYMPEKGTTFMPNTSASKKPLYLREFPDFDDKLRMIDGFVDDSWHNDAMPHISRYFYADGKDFPVRIVEIFQDYKDRDRSEFGQYEPDKPYQRFSVDVMHEDGTTEDLLTTESWEEAAECATETAGKIAAMGLLDERPATNKPPLA